MRKWFVPAVACLGLATFAGCGSDDKSDSSSAPADSGSKSAAVKVDLGNGKVIDAKTDKPKLAWFSAGASNLYLQRYRAAVLAEAEKQGLDVTVFDAKFDPTRQTEQVQNALQKGGFDAFLVTPLDENVMCPILSKQAPAQGIAVVTSLTPICGSGLKPEGEAQWTPGTLAHVQNDSTYTEDEAWFDAIAKRLPGEHTVAVLNGPPLITVAKAIVRARDSAAEKYPNLKFKYTINSDFTTPTSFAKVQTLLRAHPEIDAIASMYSDMTIGAIKAVNAAGLKGKVKIFDIGGSKQSFEAIKSGELEMTTYHTPQGNGTAAVKAIADAFAGKKVPRYIGVYGPGASMGAPLVIDKTNVDEHQPQY